MTAKFNALSGLVYSRFNIEPCVVCVCRWRFGMTLWEVSSLGDMPFADTPNRTLSEIVKSGQRPHAPDCCSKQL